MKRKTLAFCSLALLTGLVACGGGTTTNLKLNGVDYIVVSAGTLTHNTTSVSGTGSIVITNPVSAVSSKNSYKLTFTLTDGGTLDLVTNGNAGLLSGVTLRLTRTGTTLTAGQASRVNLTAIDASGTISLFVDSHNDEDPAHVLIWNGAETSFTEGTALFDSESASLNLGKGTGTSWGLKLTNATVTGAVAGTAKFIEP